MTTPLNDDISPLLFHNNKESSSYTDILLSCLPYIGPIEVVDKRQSVCHGRGLITTRDVSAGECLFVIPPIFTVNVHEVHTRYLFEQQQSNGEGEGEGEGEYDPAKVLERIAENQLVQQIQAAIAVLMDEEIIQSKQTIINRASKQLNAFLLQMSSDNKVPTTVTNSDELLETLIGNANNNDSSSIISMAGIRELDEETILHIIRRNAFGPDFHNYDRIANCWSTMSTDNVNNNNNNSIYYNRILGAYPLAAMINHSCCPNSVKVFSRIASDSTTTSLNGDNNNNISTSTDREVMIVHANTNIPKGTEITWSYLPSSTPYSIRHEALITKYGFVCQCNRCIKEEMVYTNQPNFSTMLSTLTQSHQGEDTEAISESVVLNLEAYFLTPSTTSNLSIPNETQRFLRAGYSLYYIHYINNVLQQQQQQQQLIYDNNNNEKKKEGKFDIDHLIQIVTNLHFAFVTSNNASTEHISILHVCYDLAVHLRTLAMNNSTSNGGSNNNNNDNSNSNNNEVVKCTKRVHFWTDQLKRVHMIRYGKLGENIEHVRNVMKHTKLVLRNRDGWYMTRDCFI
jgi:hypothetical protein